MRAHTGAHTQCGLCGSRFEACLINDLITAEALNWAQGKERISDEEWEQSLTDLWSEGFLSACCNTLFFYSSSVWITLSLPQSFHPLPSLPWSLAQISSAGCLQHAAGDTVNVEEESSCLCTLWALCGSRFIRKQWWFFYLARVRFLMKCAKLQRKGNLVISKEPTQTKVCSSLNFSQRGIPAG